MQLARLHAIVRAQVQGRDADETQIERFLSPAEQQALHAWQRQQRRAEEGGWTMTAVGGAEEWAEPPAKASLAE